MLFSCLLLLLHTSESVSVSCSPSGIFPPLASVSVPITNPTDTVLDNYSLLISPAVCRPDTMFFILVRHLVVHHSLHFLGGRVLSVPTRGEFQRMEAGSPPPQSHKLPPPQTLTPWPESGRKMKNLSSKAVLTFTTCQTHGSVWSPKSLQGRLTGTNRKARRHRAHLKSSVRAEIRPRLYTEIPKVTHIKSSSESAGLERSKNAQRC